MMPTIRFGHVRQGRAWRAVAASLLAVLVSFLFAPTEALAAERSLLAFKSAWFWSSNSKVTTCVYDPVRNVCQAISVGGGPAGATSPGQLTNISYGHVGIGMKDGSSDMRSYLYFDLGELPAGAQVSSARLELVASLPDTKHAQHHAKPNWKPPATANQGAAAILACAVTEPWGPADGDPPYSTEVGRPKAEEGDTNPEDDVTTTKNEPSSDCGANASGTIGKDGRTWEFDVTGIVKKWMNLELFNEGFALVPVDRGVAPTWTVEVHGAPLVLQDGENEVEYVSNKEAAKLHLEFTEAEPPVTGPTDGGGSFPPPPPPAVTPVSGPPVPTDPGVPPPPAPVAGAPQPVATTRGTTPGWVFAVFPLGLLALGLLSTAVGPDPDAAAASGNRVASVLRGRRLRRDPMVEPAATDEGS